MVPHQDTQAGPFVTTYDSKDVPIPEDYLRSDPPDAKHITYRQIDFAKTALPEYKGCYAVILENVLSPSECATLLQLAESSVLDQHKKDGSPWRPALLNAGTRNGKGFEQFVPGIRNSDRIIWDTQEIADRLWARIQTVPEVKEKLTVYQQGRGPKASTWGFHCVNERLRFLKYGTGQFFNGHCDGEYRPPKGDDGTVFCTKFTIHLYLNDSKNEADPNGPAADLEGGATSFLSELDDHTKLDVDPKVGRVLIFQHRFLYHCGAEVEKGTKYTLRTDIVYRMSKKGI